MEKEINELSSKTKQRILDSINKLIEIAEINPSGISFGYNPTSYISEGYEEMSILNKLSIWGIISYEADDFGSIIVTTTVEKLKALKDMIVSKSKQISPENIHVPTSLYIREDIIELIKNKKDSFNYTKLINLINELNKNYLDSNPYSCLSLIRTITDHIPPLLGYDSFEEVVNNHKWSPTDKKFMTILLNDRLVSDDSLHRQISSSTDLINIQNVPNPQFLNRLLQEALEKTVPVGTKNKTLMTSKTTKNKKVVDPNLRPILRAELIYLSGGPSGYFVSFAITNVGKGLASLKKVELGKIVVPINEIVLAEHERYEPSSPNIEGTSLRKGELENPELIIEYENIDGIKFQTLYKINLQIRDDKLYNLKSLTEFRMEQIS